MEKGTFILGKYEILTEIGKGATSTVYLARDSHLNKQWAIKVVDRHAAQTKIQEAHNKDDILTEAKIMRELDHPYIPRITDIEESEEKIYIVMDYVEGETLSQILDKYGKQDVEDAVRWGKQIAEVLIYLHGKGLYYRDLKPKNIMITPQGNVKIIDFGAGAKKDDDAARIGTRGYAAPEQFRGIYDERSDIYALGVTLYYVLTGENPVYEGFSLKPAEKVNPAVSSGLAKVIKTCTEKDPKERYQSAEELITALDNYHRYDAEYIEHTQKMFRRFAFWAASSVLIIAAGIFLIGLNTHIERNTYEALIASNTINEEQRIEELKEAADLKPYETAPYEKMVEVYAKDGFSEAEAQDVISVYDSHKEELKKDEKAHARVAFDIGEAFLLYYKGETDASLRNVLLTAKPFFEVTEDLPEEEAKLANLYVEMANFYEKYVLSQGTLSAKEAGVDDYRDLLKSCNDLITAASSYNGSNKERLTVITMVMVQSIVDQERDRIARTGVSEDALTAVLDASKKALLEISPYDEETKSLKESALKENENLRERIKASYETVRKKEGKSISL